MAVHVSLIGRAALLNGPVTVGAFKLGSGVGYTPDDTTLDLQGAVVFQGVPSAPVVVSPSVYRYRIALDSSTNLTFGEIGLFLPNGDLFAIASYGSLLTKTPDPDDLDGVGGSVDFFVESSGSGSVLLNANRVALNIDYVHQLPSTFASDASTAIIANPSSPSGVGPMMAYRKSALWGFDSYNDVDSGTVGASTTTSITVPGTRAFAINDLIQFTTTGFIGITRAISNVDYTGNSTTAHFAFAFTAPPPVGAQWQHLKPNLTTAGVYNGLTVGDTESAFHTALTSNPPSAPSNNSLVGRVGLISNVELDQLDLVAVADSVGYSVDDRLNLRTVHLVNGSVSTYWYNATQGTILSASPLQAHVRSAGTTKETPIVVAQADYVVAVAGNGFVLNEVLGFTRIKEGVTYVDLWWNKTRNESVGVPPPLANLLLVGAPGGQTLTATELFAGGSVVSNINPLPVTFPPLESRWPETTNTPSFVNLTASTSAVALAANPNRLTFMIHNPLPTSLYMRKGANASDTPGTYDFVIEYGNVYQSRPKEFAGEISVYSLSAGTIATSESV